MSTDSEPKKSMLWPVIGWGCGIATLFGFLSFCMCPAAFGMMTPGFSELSEPASGDSPGTGAGPRVPHTTQSQSTWEDPWRVTFEVTAEHGGVVERNCRMIVSGQGRRTQGLILMRCATFSGSTRVAVRVGGSTEQPFVRLPAEDIMFPDDHAYQHTLMFDSDAIVIRDVRVADPSSMGETLEQALDGVSTEDALATAAAITKVSETEYSVDETWWDAQLGSSAVFAGTSLLPEMDGAACVGLRLQAINEGGAAHALGLREGDVLRSAGGQRLTSMAEALALPDSLEGQRSVQVELARGGEIITMTYRYRTEAP